MSSRISTISLLSFAVIILSLVFTDLGSLLQSAIPSSLYKREEVASKAPARAMASLNGMDVAHFWDSSSCLMNENHIRRLLAFGLSTLRCMLMYCYQSSRSLLPSTPRNP